MQVLDGITAAVLGVMVPLMIADLTRGTGHFNLAQGIVGTAVGIGASLSPTLAGYLTDHFGSPVAFSGSRRSPSSALLAVWLLMPETRPAGGSGLSRAAAASRDRQHRVAATAESRTDASDAGASSRNQPQMRRDASIRLR